jgi:hypothetical protein
MLFLIFNSDGGDRLLRPLTDNITINVVDPEYTEYNVVP